MPKEFAYELDQKVAITASGEVGTVIGRADYSSDEDRYFVEYKNAQGVAVQQWWGESSLHRVA